jgi:hypothetical protein
MALSITIRGPIQPKQMDHARRIRWNAFELYLAKEIHRFIVPIVAREIGETDKAFVAHMIVVKKK